MKDWNQYLARGLVKAQKTNFAQIEQQIVRAERDLKTFYLVMDADPEWASTIAYQAKKALVTANALSKAIKDRIRKNNPRFNFKF